MAKAKSEPKKVPYEKSHTTYEAQVDLLLSRGLVIQDRDHALAILKRVGYYRFSAYLYPMRRLLPKPASKHEFRSANFIPGASFENAYELYMFDVKFRQFLGDAIREVELVLRSQLAYIVGREGKDAHVSSVGLDLSSPAGVSDAMRWMSARTKCERFAQRTEPFEHFRDKYSDVDVPIWIMIETLDLGGLIALFDATKVQFRNEVSREFGVRQASKLSKWLPHLRNVRNAWGHHGRTWNARFSYPVSDLQHIDARLPALEGVQRSKPYATLSLLTILLTSTGLDEEFRQKVHDIMDALPEVELAGGDVEAAMGFPPGWRELDFWKLES